MALGVTNSVNTAELKGISGMEFVTKIDVFDEFHELATILLEASKVEMSIGTSSYVKTSCIYF